MVKAAKRAGVGVFVAVALALAGCGGNGDGAVRATPGQTTGPGVPAQPTKAATGTGSEAGPDDPEAVIDPNGDAADPDDNHTVAIGDTFQVPDMAGMDVQAAQDLLQGRNSFKLQQKD